MGKTPLHCGQSTLCPTPAMGFPSMVAFAVPSSTRPPCVVVSPTQIMALAICSLVGMVLYEFTILLERAPAHYRAARQFVLAGPSEAITGRCGSVPGGVDRTNHGRLKLGPMRVATSASCKCRRPSLLYRQIVRCSPADTGRRGRCAAPGRQQLPVHGTSSHRFGCVGLPILDHQFEESSAEPGAFCCCRAY